MIGVAVALTWPLVGADDGEAVEAWPTRPITLIVPYPTGGANDMLGRLIGQKLADRLKQQIIVDNRPGAGTLIGASQAARAVPNGYTLFLGGFASNAVTPLLVKTDFHPVDDFAPIGLIGTAPVVAITHDGSPYRTLTDLIEAARANPGRLTYGSSGNGSPLHMAGVSFCLKNKLDMVHVPYKGGSAHILDLMAGRLDVIFDSTTNATPLITGGKVRPIAISAKRRNPDFPDVPTFAELGVADLDVNGWYALFAPRRTPTSILATLSDALQEALAAPDVIERLRSVGVTPGTGTRRELADYTAREHAKYRNLVRDGRIKAD
ncbi:Bug family tripartite tricarboxylate transporter substrate binding protein [Rhodoplanes azumiensis]|uniref:Bug family tripartite tricarboxylate transporter substrate binding protein n=1 Tax=Rhodoplanes azumiensis TaxID=1897628 RepID=A0ABW5AGP6_9BRAD